MKPYKITSEALAEIDEAAAFYNNKQPALGKRFVDAIEASIFKIRKNPMIYRRIDGDIRKLRVPRFPFGIIYRTRDELVEIIAVMHLRRKPDYWKKR